MSNIVMLDVSCFNPALGRKLGIKINQNPHLHILCGRRDVGEGVEVVFILFVEGVVITIVRVLPGVVIQLLVLGL